jgi:hypothetical protein
MAETLSTRELAASAAVAEAEAGREREVEEAQAAAAQLRAKMASLEREHAAQVGQGRAMHQCGRIHVPAHACHHEFGAQQGLSC